MKNLRNNNKKLLISVIVVSVLIIVASGILGYIKISAGDSASASQSHITGNAPSTGSYSSAAQTVLIKKSGLTGTSVPMPAKVAEVDKNLAIDCDVIRGAMTSPGDPPPLIKVSLTNTTARTIEIRKVPKVGQYGVQVESVDKDGYPIDYNAWVFMAELDLPPKVSTSINVELISSLQTKGFKIYKLYKQ